MRTENSEPASFLFSFFLVVMTKVLQSFPQKVNEVGEETGWTIAGPRFLSAYRRFAYMPDHDLHAEKLCEIWLARPIRRLGPPSEPGHSAHWVRPAVAADLLADPGARAILSRWLKAHG